MKFTMRATSILSVITAVVALGAVAANADEMDTSRVASNVVANAAANVAADDVYPLSLNWD
ncbi:hypothetical protein OHA37_18980 [Streptomyces sp. NBC_00335]|uniref:hypothetical protein n=1 Tax=unclassified Streptomyces TaxID=2593676 RepID=UPI002258E6F7|nr:MULTISPECIES: hypothetical protein [unclassified Streptomyces]MCX5405966.1 hypothetical protein [Streptomyces sp. NBC_00086]